MSRRLRVVASFWLAALALAPAALADEPAPRKLSERDAVAAAVAQNPTLHVALLRAAQDRSALAAEQAAFVPIFDASAGYTHTRSPSLSGNDAVRVGGSDVVDLGAGITKPFSFGTQLSASVSAQRSLRTASIDPTLTGVASDGFGLGPGYLLVGRLGLLQPLLRGAGDNLGLAPLRQAKLTLAATELAAQEAASTLLSQVVSAYWELWYSAEVVRIDEASRELAKAQQDQAQQQVASGALAPASALPYATQVAELEEALLSARTEVRQRELELGQLLGDGSQVGASLTADSEPTLPGEDEPVEARAVSDALQSSYARKQLQAQLAIAKDQLSIAGEAERSRLDLDAYVQAEGLGNRRVPPAFEQFGKMGAVSAHVGLTFEAPVTDTRRAAQQQVAQLSAHVAEQRIRETELAIRKGIASAIARRRAARERLELTNQTEKVARKQAEAERERFRSGSSIAISVQQAEDSLRQAQLRAQRGRVDLVLADLELAELRGTLLTRYRSAVAALPSERRTILSNPSPNF